MRTDTPGTILRYDDFQLEESVSFPPKGNTTPPHITPAHSLAHTFKLKSYSPKVFKRVREFFDIDATSYMQSVCGKCPPTHTSNRRQWFEYDLM
jgi:hypothetical protein